MRLAVHDASEHRMRGINLVELYGTHQDITVIKEQEAAMAALSRRNELLLTSIGEGIFGINREGRVTFANPACCTMLDYTEAEMLGKNMHDLVHHSKADGARYPVTECPIFRCLHQGGTANINDEVFWRKDGTPLDVEYTCTTIYESGRPEADKSEADRPAGTVVSFRDTTERRRAAEALRASAARLAEINAQLEQKITLVNEQAEELECQKQELEAANIRLEALATTDGLTGIKNHRAFQERLASEIARSQRHNHPLSLLLMDVDKFKTFNDTFGHPAGDRVLKSVARILQEQARDSDFVARYGGEEFVAILPETGKEDALKAAERFRQAIEFSVWPERPITISIGVATQIPEQDMPQALIDRGDRALYQSKQNGRNCATHSEDTSEDWSEETNKVISELLQQLLAAESDQFSTANEKIRETMLKAYNATVESWCLLVDMKDRETEGHSERVTQHMERVAKYVGMNADEAQYAVWGAMLHDIGKVGVPDAILLKPGPLTEEERAIMRLHPVVAQQMLAGIPFLKPALAIPYCHHEKWDGSGYPRGLKGEEIPFEARLFAVIDVYDALKSDRPYRSGWPEQKVHDYLREQSGKHFDPRAVEVFFAMLKEQKDAFRKAA